MHVILSLLLIPLAHVIHQVPYVQIQVIHQEIIPRCALEIFHLVVDGYHRQPARLMKRYDVGALNGRVSQESGLIFL